MIPVKDRIKICSIDDSNRFVFAHLQNLPVSNNGEQLHAQQRTLRLTICIFENLWKKGV